MNHINKKRVNFLHNLISLEKTFRKEEIEHYIEKK